MKRILGLILPALCCAGQAQALKCAAPDVQSTFQAAMAAPERYVILRGSFAFDAGLLPGDATTRGDPNLPPPAPFAADFTGQLLAADGFTTDLSRPVIIQSVCFGPWCGQIGAGADVMVFAQNDDDGTLRVAVDPCGTWVFLDPSPDMLDLARTCTANPAVCAG